uniref:Uncharacterized protein n=1 Tax=Oryza barthii TaxID=65489 RepID=A0A0D3HP69_9ORYZ
MATSGAGDTPTPLAFTASTTASPLQLMIIIQRDYQDLPGRNRRFRRHRHPSRRFPAGVQDMTASIHRAGIQAVLPVQQ